MNETDLVVQDLLEEPSDDTYIEESYDDLEEFRSEGAPSTHGFCSWS